MNIVRRSLVLRLVLILLTLAPALSGQSGTPTWVLLDPSGTPPSPRADASAVYLPAANQMIIFGGNPSGCTSVKSLNDAWVLGGANGMAGTPVWDLLVTNGGPPPARRGHSAVYSAASDRMIIFGGDTQGCSRKRLNDVWVLKDASATGGVPTWEQLTPSGTAPPARAEHVAFYDQANNRMMIFGGDGLPSGNLHDLWVLTHADGTGGEPEWENLTEDGTAPSATGYASATYDPVTNRLTLFGGWVCCKKTVSNQTWVLIHANGLGGTPQWIRGKPTGTLPTARAGAQAKYNPAQNSAVYFGGSQGNDLWWLANANGNGQASWTKMSTQGTPPAGRGGVSTNAASV